ncbi:IS3 family transposase, partial [Staphylococcus epidermidis]|uniref:IS3 family transposase n=1 Tax=Staphylococcus epidermidis TaxID=1282 RepID=UPI00311F562D
AIGLKKATYHDERKRISNRDDKYASVKEKIIEITNSGKYRGRLTYGYRRVQTELVKLNIHLADTVVRHLMSELNVQVSLYNRHKNGKYSSYKGTI